MEAQAVQAYTLAGATGEIFIMLLVAFVLGALVGRLLTPTEVFVQEKEPVQHRPALLSAPKTNSPALQVQAPAAVRQV